MSHDYALNKKLKMATNSVIIDLSTKFGYKFGRS